MQRTLNNTFVALFSALLGGVFGLMGTFGTIMSIIEPYRDKFIYKIKKIKKVKELKNRKNLFSKTEKKTIKLKNKTTETYI